MVQSCYQGKAIHFALGHRFQWQHKCLGAVEEDGGVSCSVYRVDSKKCPRYNYLQIIVVEIFEGMNTNYCADPH